MGNVRKYVVKHESLSNCGENETGLTATQLQNLRTLRDFLDQYDDSWGKFDMSSFLEGENDVPLDKSVPLGHCGTAGCAVGHAVFCNDIIGREKHVGKAFHETREDGVRRLVVEPVGSYDFMSFTAFAEDTLTNDVFEVFDWLFESHWAEHDNTIAGVQARINYMLEHGVPVALDRDVYGHSLDIVDMVEDLQDIAKHSPYRILISVEGEWYVRMHPPAINDQIDVPLALYQAVVERKFPTDPA